MDQGYFSTINRVPKDFSIFSPMTFCGNCRKLWTFKTDTYFLNFSEKGMNWQNSGSKFKWPSIKYIVFAYNTQWKGIRDSPSPPRCVRN